MCQPSGATRAAMRSSTSRGVKSTSRLTKLKRTPAHAGAVHPLELVVGHLLADEGDALGLVVGRLERVDHRAIVLAVAGRLHDHVLVEAEEIAQREQLLLGRVAGRVFALRRVGKLGSPGRTRGSAHRPRPPAACISASTDWDETECSRHSSARGGLLGSSRCLDPLDRQRYALPDADAHGGERAPAAARLQADASRSTRAARPTCRADGRARSRRRSG